MADKWLTVTEAAQISGYHPYYLRDLVRKGKIKAKRFGPLWQVSQQSLQKYLQSAEHSDDHRRGPRSD
jgi:excisionase family DNA binding protein